MRRSSTSLGIERQASQSAMPQAEARVARPPANVPSNPAIGESQPAFQAPALIPAASRPSTKPVA